MKKTADVGDDAELEQHRGVAVDSPSTEPQRCAADGDDVNRNQCVSGVPDQALTRYPKNELFRYPKVGVSGTITVPETVE